MSMKTAGDDGDGAMADMNVTPLVDVMLVLLVIFMVTAPLIVPQSMKIKLPQTVSVTQQDQAKNQTLVVMPNGSLVYKGADIQDAAWTHQLKQDKADPRFQIQIQADESVPYGRIAQVMALAQSAGVTRLSFVTLPGSNANMSK
jgi:biopolymer transport protein ExbD